MRNEDKNFDNFDTLMLYLNESENQQTHDEILSSIKGCKQLERLQNDMNIIEKKLNGYEIDEDYGSNLWNKISNRLDEKPKLSLFNQFIRYIKKPQLSTVGFVTICAIATIFYTLGHKQATQINDIQLQNNQQLLTQNMQLHLAQSDMFLTQVSNMNSQENSPVMIKTAENLLASNRIYKTAYANNDNKRLKNLLTELEQVLLEISNGNSQNSQHYISEYANRKLLYKVKSSNQKLKSQLSNQQDTSI